MKFIRLPLLLIFCLFVISLCTWKGTESIFLIVAAAVTLCVAFVAGRKIKENTTLKIKSTKKDAYLTELLAERNWLLREIQHRVKNNLQIVLSLLNSQSNYLEDETALQALHDSRNRIYSLSLIYKKLYQQDSSENVDMNVYVRELVTYLQDSYSSTTILFSINTDEIFLDVERAAPIGLIINETVTNAIKHAFTDKHIGTVNVTFKRSGQGKLILTVADNGRGLPDGFDVNGFTSLGMNLIKGLAEEISGDLSIYNNNGTVIKLVFLEEDFNEIATIEIK
ncbi:hypothetical protein Q765_10630 [Flavobacterium rivuli WB 3.3-2 = DSM 21788]|uniref:histidine kinase n=1 Tax=Flavobacterium rivuli WB 3.3-2 = DSM 21788 TaxID=1121895 RepID=A0A0A2M356_9FLAO|nr:sensor histidine kinase [Flavobacterium rivuli]KGO86659.1 hypothetical protein Q765_10630 [Flavobacterium rivuli WB 3.3-2 = DSM 21788]